MKNKKKIRPKALQRTLLTLILSSFLAFAAWTFESRNELRLPTAGNAAELYANQSRDDLLHAYLTAIKEAKESIFLMVYSLTDQAIIKALKDKALEGVSVRVICDAKAAPYIDKKLGGNITTVRRFGPGLMHLKILVIDRKQTWIGSANMTRESLTMHGNLVTAIDNPQVAETIIAKALSLEAEGHGPAFLHTNFHVGDQTLELWFLPDDRQATTRIKQLIKEAKKTIHIAMFTWTRYDFANAVIAAHNRGVEVKVVLDNCSAKGASAKIVDILKKAHVPLSVSRGSALLHHKFMYIDGKVLINGSANWTKAAFTQNDDCFIVLDNLTPQQNKKMDDLWAAIVSQSKEPSLTNEGDCR